MVNVLALFGVPVDQTAFEEYFERTHYPLLHNVTNVQEIVVNRIQGAVEGSSPLYAIVELRFASEDQMAEGLNSEAGQKMARDYSRFATGGVTVLICRGSSENLMPQLHRLDGSFSQGDAS